MAATPRLRKDGRYELRVSIAGKRISLYGREPAECYRQLAQLAPCGPAASRRRA